MGCEDGHKGCSMNSILDNVRGIYIRSGVLISSIEARKYGLLVAMGRGTQRGRDGGWRMARRLLQRSFCRRNNINTSLHWKLVVTTAIIVFTALVVIFNICGSTDCCNLLRNHCISKRCQLGRGQVSGSSVVIEISSPDLRSLVVSWFHNRAYPGPWSWPYRKGGSQRLINAGGEL